MDKKQLIAEIIKGFAMFILGLSVGLTIAYGFDFLVVAVGILSVVLYATVILVNKYNAQWD